MARILVAEDDQDIRELIVLTLEFSGYDVESVENGAAAVKIAQANQGQFDLILMDVRMPHMTGYEACRQLKNINITKHIPIVFLSAKGQEEEVQTGLDAGAEMYILKPFAPDELISTVAKILNAH
ncbi:MAG: response regulator [Chloroflexi bacterium]|nr:response regulator [Chloroflexota bacterium]